MAGAKPAYVLERHFWPTATAFRSPEMFSGFRLAGGIFFAALYLPALTRVFRLEPAATSDRLRLPSWGAVAVVHLGCFLNGCCFGTETRLPWAVQLEETSVTYALQRKFGWLSGPQTVSVPVHPLPLYFAVLALVAALPRLISRQGQARLGTSFWGSAVFYGLGSIALEFLRPVVLWVNVLAALGLVAIGPGHIARFGCSGLGPSLGECKHRLRGLGKRQGAAAR